MASVGPGMGPHPPTPSVVLLCRTAWSENPALNDSAVAEAEALPVAVTIAGSVHAHTDVHRAANRMHDMARWVRITIA